MKKYVLPVLLLLLALALSACGDETAIEGETSAAKTSENIDEEEGTKDEEEEESDDIWTYYDDATWSEDYEGLKMEIQKVVVSDEAPAADGSDEKQSAVGVKFKMENTTDDKFTAYPDQAVLVTSTGEQLDADMFYSDHIGGEIDKGVIKEGDIIWYLERGEAEKIEWIKMSWNARPGPEDDFETEGKDFEVELQLK